MSNIRKALSKPAGQRAPRRAAHFWSSLNDWWRSYLADEGRRPVTTEVQVWFAENADAVWGDAKPSWKEARIHAKCLRSTEQVKNYFREYRARAKGVEYKEDVRSGGKDSPQDIKVEFEEGQQPLAAAGHSSQRHASTSDHPPGSPGDASGPSSSDFALEPQFPDKAPDPAAIPGVPLLSNPTTVTTGNGLPPTWQQRSASERFPPPSVRAQAGQEQQQPWNRSRSSVIFQPPSSAPHSKKAVSPFILTQSSKEGDLAAPGSLLPPGSPVPSLSMAAKAQSFSCSSKRRHTHDDAFPPNPSSPSFLRHAASFSHGSFNPTHVPPMYTPTLAYGVPVNNTPSCQQPEASALKPEEPGSFYIRPAPLYNPQTFRYPVSTGQRPLKAQGQGGCEPHASEWDRAPFSPLGAEEPDAQPQPQQLLMGSMDRQLVEDIARDAALRSSMIEQAACSGGGRLRELPQRRCSSALQQPASQACGDGGFGGHAYAAPAMQQQQPASDPADDADISDFWDLADKVQASGAADMGDAFGLLSCPQFQGLPDPCQPSPRAQQAQHQQGLRQGAAWRGRPQVQQYPPGLARTHADVSDPGGICRLRAVSYPMAGLYPPLAPNPSGHALGRPAPASSRLDPAHHTRPPAAKFLSAARPAASQQQSMLYPAAAQQQSQSQSHARSFQHLGLAHPFTACTDRGGPSDSSSVDCWSGKNPTHNQNQNQNQNQPPPAAFQQQQQQQQQLLLPPGHSNSNPSGSSSSHLLSSSRQEGHPFAGAQHELKLEAGHLAKADSMGLPFQALRVHSAALAPIMDQGNAGQLWGQQEWSHMEWEGRCEHSQGLEGPEAPL